MPYTPKLDATRKLFADNAKSIIESAVIERSLSTVEITKCLLLRGLRAYEVIRDNAAYEDDDMKLEAYIRVIQDLDWRFRLRVRTDETGRYMPDTFPASLNTGDIPSEQKPPDQASP